MVIKSFIHVFSRRTTCFHGWTELFELNFFIRKTLLWAGKIILAAGQFAQCPALNEIPGRSKVKKIFVYE